MTQDSTWSLPALAGALDVPDEAFRAFTHLQGLGWRAHQTTGTTGTGTLTLNAAATSRRSFQAAYGVSAVQVKYVIAGTSFYEMGYGSFDGGTPGTLTRPSGNVVASSNAGSLVSLPAGTADVYAWIDPGERQVVTGTGAVTLALADTGSVLELRPSFGLGMITALVRIAGRPMGLIANNPLHLGGAIDADAADKAARFLQLCDAHDLPILSLIDTPGFMVGPEAEKAAQVRRVCRMFVGGANLEVPIFAVALRKGYGLGALAMVGGNFHASVFTVSWPTGEFGGMGFEGAVRLAYRKELEAIADPAARDAEFRRLVDAMYRRGKAISMAGMLEIDDVIDPAETRDWLVRGLDSVPAPVVRQGKKRNFIDTW